MPRHFIPAGRYSDCCFHAYVAGRDGPWKADSAVRKILKTVRGLETVQMRGFSRPDLGDGLRSWRIGKRATVVFEVLEQDALVVIHGVFTGGQDIEAHFKRH